MRFSLLGPLAVTDDAGGQVLLSGPRLRVLLATLLLHANIVMPTDELAEIVWDGSPPSGAMTTLRSYVRRLRRAMGPAAVRIVARDPGYLILADQSELDVLEFEALCRDARMALRAGEWAEASATATRALRLWQAAPLLDVSAEALRVEFVPRLERLRLQAFEDCFDAGLRLGRHEELIPALLDMTAQHGLRERFHAQLMLALAGTGRRAEALRVYQHAFGVLADELGVEPGPELRDIHRQILAEDPLPGGVPGIPIAGEAVGPVTPPAQLPSAIADFTGRQVQAGYLCDALTRDEAGAGTGTGAVRVAVVAGAAGIGKTMLAMHVARQVRESFPDGQLYAQLSGASSQPAVPAEVLVRFLGDLGVDGRQIPASEETRAALYRTRLAGRRMLIMLDDARDTAQVRPLLPGSSSCAVLVTTRNRTPYLVSTEFVDLGAMPEPEALTLFSRIAGAARTTAEPAATAEILRVCAGLPLAIRICATRLATRPQWRISTLAARLHDERRRMNELRIGDLAVRASFQVSYDNLRAGRDQADPVRAFRLLGLWPGQRISLPAAAALTGDREEDLAGALEELVDASLLESPEPNWYQFHDLLRLFAAERTEAEDTGEDRLAALTRLLSWYVAMATAVADLLSPHRYRIVGDEPPAPGIPLDPECDALAWYDHERANLMPVIRKAAAAGLHGLAWRLATVLFGLYTRRHNWTDCIAAHRIAVGSAQASGSRLGKALALHNLGWGLAAVGDVEAFGALQQASAIRREMNDVRGQAQAAIALAEAHYRIHGPRAAYEHSLENLGLIRGANDFILLAAALSNIGDHCRELGKLDEATGYLQEALAILRTLGGGDGFGFVLGNLGSIYFESGRFPEAIATLSEAHEFHVAQGHLLGQAEVLRDLGKAQRACGQAYQARESLEAAMVLLKELEAETGVEDIRSALGAPEREGEHSAEPSAT